MMTIDTQPAGTIVVTHIRGDIGADLDALLRHLDRTDGWTVIRHADDHVELCSTEDVPASSFTRVSTALIDPEVLAKIATAVRNSEGA